MLTGAAAWAADRMGSLRPVLSGIIERLANAGRLDPTRNRLTIHVGIGCSCLEELEWSNRHGQLHRCRSVRSSETKRGASHKGGTSTAPIYRSLAAKGLIRKDYINGDAGTGGVYLWESRASAEAWFTEERMVDFGVRPRLTWYDTHVTVDNLKSETRVNGKALAEAG